MENFVIAFWEISNEQSNFLFYYVQLYVFLRIIFTRSIDDLEL